MSSPSFMFNYRFSALRSITRMALRFTQLQTALAHKSLCHAVACLLALSTTHINAQALDKTSTDDGKLPSVVSINLCADQLVLLLAAPEQILSLSNLSHQEAGSHYFKQARSYPVNEGHAEQVLGLEPDLVIAGQYSNKYTIDLLRETGLRVETLPIANDIDTMLSNIQTVSRWLGKKESGTAIVQKLNSQLQALSTPPTVKPVAAVYDPNGYTSGAQSLRGQMMERSGWSNAAALAGIQHFGQLSLESIIRLKPDALIVSPYSPGTYSRAQAMSKHPALLASGVNPHIINIPSRKTVCAGPWTIDVIEQLQAERLQHFGPDSHH